MKNKRIPKTHLPKYTYGTKTTTLSNGNEVSMYGTGPTQGTDATSNLYNEKRSSGMSTQQKNDMYAAIGAAGTSYAMANNQAAYADPNYKVNNSSKGAWQSTGGAEGTADSIQSGVASAIPIAGLFHGLSESAQSAVGTQGANAGAQYFFEPHKLITHAIDGEGLFNAKDREEHGLGKLNNLTHAYGGKSITPNAEIEKQENVVAPNGGFLQADGPSHEQGGVPVKLPGNSMIFSDRLKAPGTKKTFADLNKINNTNKEDKILDSNKTSSMSKRTAELMKFVKNKNSEILFNEQESLKQSKVEAYAKKMGVTLPQAQEAPEEGVQFPMGGVKLPMYPYGGDMNGDMLSYGNDPRFYNYQGNKITVPNLKALNKDSGVSPEIGLNNYNSLLNTRTQVRDSNVQMGKQLPKFEYLNDPSKGSYDEQFNAYKKLYLPGFKYGGRKLPKYEFGKLTPEEEGADLESVWNNSSAKIDAQHGWNSNDETTRPGYRKQFDWQGLGSNVAMGLANNAGNIYNLSRYNKPEIEKYERMKATFLDPSAALRDAEAQTRRAEYNVRGASGGNAGTYLSNRVALNAQNTMNKARIHNEFENANAGIANSVGQYNNELARQEVIANAMNRARTRSGKGEAIGSMGYNIANQMMDNKKTNMDQETLQLMMKYYDTPEFKRMMKEYKGKK